MKELVTLVSLFPKKTEEIASEVCLKLNKFLLNACDLVDYELVDKEDMEKNCGKDYLEKSINKVLYSITEYESAIVVVDYDLLFRPKVLERFKERTSIVYLRLEDFSGQKLLEEREKRLINNSKLIIDVAKKQEQEIVDEVIKQIMPLISTEV